MVFNFFQIAFPDYDGNTFSPRDFNGSMMWGLLSAISKAYPMMVIAIRLLIVMLIIIAIHAGNVSPKMPGGGK